MQQILYVYPFSHSVVKQDKQLLQKHFIVRCNLFPSHVKWMIPIHFIRQLFFFFVHIRRTSAIVVSFAGYHSFLPSLLGKLLKIPTFLIAHGAEACSIKEHGYGLLRKQPLKWFVTKSIEKSSKLLPVSEFIIKSKNSKEHVDFDHKQGIKNLLPHISFQYRTIHNGFDFDYWKINDHIEKNRKLVITVAQRDQYWRKGIDKLIEVADLLPYIEFEVLGMQGHPTEKSLPSNVKYLPFLDRDQTRNKFQTASIYMQLSRWEGFGCALCEAMLCGCIPVVSNVNLLPHIVSNVGIILKNFDTKTIEEAIKEAISKVDNEKIRITAARKIIDEYPMTLRESELVKVIDESLSSQK